MPTRVIAGAGLAGAKAAETLRDEGLPSPGTYDQVVYRGDRAAMEFIAFWLSGGTVVAGMNVNVWDVNDDIQSLIRSAHEVDPSRLADPDTPSPNSERTRLASPGTPSRGAPPRPSPSPALTPSTKAPLTSPASRSHAQSRPVIPTCPRMAVDPGSVVDPVHPSTPNQPRSPDQPRSFARRPNVGAWPHTVRHG